MDLALYNLQMLICQKTNQPTNQPTDKEDGREKQLLTWKTIEHYSYEMIIICLEHSYMDSSISIQLIEKIPRSSKFN